MYKTRFRYVSLPLCNTMKMGLINRFLEDMEAAPAAFAVPETSVIPEDPPGLPYCERIDCAWIEYLTLFHPSTKMWRLRCVSEETQECEMCQLASRGELRWGEIVVSRTPHIYANKIPVKIDPGQRKDGNDGR